MFKIKKYLLIAVWLVGIAFLPQFITAEEVEKTAGANDATEINGAKLTAVKGKYKRTEVNRLKVEGLSDPKTQKIINKTLQKAVADFAKEYQEPYFTSAVTFSAVYNENNLLTMLLQEYYYPEKAAHPMVFQKAFTFNLKTGKAYELSEIFERFSGYKDVLNDMIKNSINRRAISLLEPFESIDENQEFYLKKDALVIYYQRYRYTPYAHGSLIFEIPYSDLEDILAEEFKHLAKPQP